MLKVHDAEANRSPVRIRVTTHRFHFSGELQETTYAFATFFSKWGLLSVKHGPIRAQVCTGELKTGQTGRAFQPPGHRRHFSKQTNNARTLRDRTANELSAKLK